LPTGKFIRISAKTRSWENAERKARIMEINADPLRPAVPEILRVTIENAVEDFLTDEEARQLAKTTTCQSKTLFQKQLLNWAKGESISFLDELTTVRLRRFRASWKNGALTSQRKHHRLNGFFDFCVENEWLQKNPSKKMKPVQVSPDPTDYFPPAGTRMLRASGDIIFRAYSLLIHCPNPQTGEAIKIKAKTVVRLRPAKVLKDAVLK
jgi:hypothetical protein